MTIQLSHNLLKTLPDDFYLLTNLTELRLVHPTPGRGGHNKLTVLSYRRVVVTPDRNYSQVDVSGFMVRIRQCLGQI